jgi:hypothetical protein
MAKLLEITLESHPSHNRNPFGVGPSEESVIQGSRRAATLGRSFARAEGIPPAPGFYISSPRPGGEGRVAQGGVFAEPWAH